MSRSRPGGPLWVAPLADAGCLLAFVALGRTSHDLHGGGAWFVAVLWPFAVGWAAAALVTRLYAAPARPSWRAVATVLLGVTLALVLRATLTGRSTPVVFGVVALCFLALATLGWRGGVALCARVTRTRASASPSRAGREAASGRPLAPRRPAAPRSGRDGPTAPRAPPRPAGWRR